MSSDLYVGVEGGGSCTKGILINAVGDTLAVGETGCTNHWGIGFETTGNRIVELVGDLLAKAQCKGESVNSVGLSLSGIDTPQNAIDIAETLYQLQPNLILGDNKAKAYNDSISALETATNQGGVVIISGTGQNCRLVEPITGEYYNSGGYGNVIGDEGSAYWIAWTALKTLIDHDDCFHESEHSVEYVRQAMKEYFQVSNNLDMLTHLYTNFKKSFIARFTMRLVEGADRGDSLCLSIFKQAGTMLAKHVMAVCKRSSPDKFPNGLTIVCVGSVWKSYKYLKSSFEQTLGPIIRQFGTIKLTKLTENGAIGAAVVGARDTGYKVAIDFEKTTETIAILS